MLERNCGRAGTLSILGAGRLLSIVMSDDSLVPASPASEIPPASSPAAEISLLTESSSLPPPAATPPEPPVVAVPAPPARHPFVFHGTEREYFRLWIVNTLLTLLTFGLFAAWAKVRKRRYLRGNTELMGHRFDYRANPWRLLVGHLIVVALFTAYGLFGQVYPAVRIAAIVVGVILLPWIVVRSLAFNAHNTAYRGMRFSFHQGYLGAAVLYFARFFLVLLTVGFYYPAWIRRQRIFVIENHRLGDAFFRSNPPVGIFFGIYLGMGVVVAAAAILGGMFTSMRAAEHPGKLVTLLELAPFFVLYGLAFFLAKTVIFAELFNHVWNHTRLDNHRFAASVETGTWVKLQFTNLFAVLGTVGLLYPWAQVRSARYLLSRLQFVPAGPIDQIERLGRDEGSALGETASEFFGLDFGL